MIEKNARTAAGLAKKRRIIRTWQNAKSPGDAATKLQMKENHLTAIAAFWRVRGVPMKLFGPSTKQKGVDWKELARYARRFL